MPSTKREELYFGLMMCFGMVVVMTLYNVIRNDLLGSVSLTEMLVQFILGFMIAFLLELFIVGPVAKKFVFSLAFDKSKKIFVILSLSLCMVTGMVVCMSLFGLGSAYAVNGLRDESLLASYFSILGHNFLFALPLQLLIMGPLVRYLFAKFVKDKRITASGS